VDASFCEANNFLISSHALIYVAGLDLEDLITATGQHVFGKHPQGQIVVAGMTAQDTADAAKELLTAIESM